MYGLLQQGCCVSSCINLWEPIWFPCVFTLSNSGIKVAILTMTDQSKQPSSRPSPSDRDRKAFDKEALPDKIGSSLRNLYDEVLNEDVPDDFLNLLRKADEVSQ